jgi:hypothetical protein
MVINADKFLNKSSGRLAMQKAQQEKMVGGGPSNIVLSKKSIKGIEGIKINVIKIEDIFKGSLALDKKQLNDKKKATSKKRKEDIETKLETKPNAKSGGKVKLPAAPRMGILDFIKNFIGNVLLGYFAVRLIKHLPKIMPILKFLGGAADFIINTGGFLLNGLATFLDIGYKAYDATRGFLKSFGGENFVKVFDAFNGAVGSVIEAAIIASIALASQGKDGVLDIGMDLLKDRLLGQGAQAATQAATSSSASAAAGGGASTAGGTAAQAGGLGVGAVAAVVAGAGLLSSALGEGAFQVRKFAVKPIQKLENDQKNDKNPFTRFGRGVALNMIRPLFGLFQAVGVLLDIVGAPFRYAIELLRYPFLSEEDKVKQAGNLAKFDARIREDFRKALNMLTLGLAFKEKGSFGNIYGNKGAQKEMMGKMQGGGITRGGKSAGRVKRTVSKGKYKRVLTPQKPSKTELKTEAFTKPENKTLKESTEELDKTKYFGPILAISSKIMNKEEPTDRDYQNVGLGINLLIAKGIQDGQLKGGIVAKFAGGGLVDPDVLSAAETGGDISNWVAKTFRGAIETGAQRTMRLMKEMREKKAATSSSPSPGFDGGELETAGGAVAASEFYKEIGANLDQWDIYRNSVALIESGGKYSAMGGSGDHFDGRYQMGAAAKTDGSKVAGISNPGHSSDPNAHVRISYRNNPQLQETVFTGFTIANHRYLMRNPKYKSASVERKLEILGYAHNQGMGGAERWMTTGVVGVDGFGTKGTKYTDLIAKNFRAKKSGGAMELAQGAIPVTTGAQSLSRGTITSYFGSKEGFRKKAHEGVDIGLNQGTPLSFKMKGTVIDSFRTSSTDREAGGGYGSYMDVKFENGQILRLAHLSKIYPHKKFEPGNVVGLSGGTPGYPGSGRSGGPHLHLEQHSSKIGLEETLKGKLDPIKYGGFGLVQTGGVIKKFALGGRIHKLTFAMLGEKGPEFVFDADTTAGLDRLAPQLLEKLNIAKTKPQLASILQSYASYDARSVFSNIHCSISTSSK